MLENPGAEVKPISLPHNIYSIDISPSHCDSRSKFKIGSCRGAVRVRVGARLYYHVQEDAHSSGFGPEVKRRIMLGTYALTAVITRPFYEQATGPHLDSSRPRTSLF